MADRMLFISWGDVVRGREERALEVFDRIVGMYGRFQQQGRIERFDVTLLEPNGSIDGCFQVLGSRAQLDDVRADLEFRRSIAAATLIVDDLRVIDGVCNEGVAETMELFREAAANVPQMVG